MQFWRYIRFYAKNFRGHVTQATPLLGESGRFWGKLFVCPLGFPKMKPCTKFEVPNSSSFKDMFDRMPKYLGVMWPRPCPFWGDLFIHPVSIPNAKLLTKFEVSSLIIFEDILDHLPENLGVTWPRLRPFRGKFFVRPLGFPTARLSQDKVMYQIWSLYVKQFWRHVWLYAKNFRGHVT